MAKDIKAIQCPHCGSVYKNEIKSSFYKCLNCGTEYFLDSDDVHVYHHHERSVPLQSSAPPGNQKLPVYILLGAVSFILIVYLVSLFSAPKYVNTNATGTYKLPRMYGSSFVYENTATGDPVYLRLGTDQIDQGNNKYKKELHVQFNNAMNGQLIVDRIFTDQDLFNNDCTLTFKRYSPTLIYAIGCSNMLLKLDTRADQLTDVSESTFKDFPQLSSGVAKLEFDYSKEMIRIMTNEGKSYYYFPLAEKLVEKEEQVEALWKQLKDNHYFLFGTLSDDFGTDRFAQLIEVKNAKEYGQVVKRDLTPGTNYFDPKIIYQDDQNLLIVSNTTAADNPPVIVKRIDVATGRIQWALPPDRYFLYSVARCKQGFAIEYRKGEAADYVHGVMVISPSGKLLHNYQLGRSE